jgi:hypothetical protein
MPFWIVSAVFFEVPMVSFYRSQLVFRFELSKNRVAHGVAFIRMLSHIPNMTFQGLRVGVMQAALWKGTNFCHVDYA